MIITRVALLCVLIAQFAGILLAASACIVLTLDESRGTHVLGALRWPGFSIAFFAGLTCLIGFLRDLRSREVTVPGRSLRALFALLVSGAAVQVVISPTYKPILFDLVYAVLFSGFALLRFLEPRIEALMPPKLVRRVDLLVFQCALAVVMVELGLRGMSKIWPTPMLARDEQDIDAAIDRFRYRPGGLRYGFQFNSKGYYDEEFERADFTVVSIGDSFSIGVVPHRYHFTTVCERSLHGSVIHNLGYAGTGPGAYLRVLENDGLELHPDLILINVFVGNDLHDSGRWNRPRGLLRSCCDRRNILTYLLPSRILTLSAERVNQKQAHRQTMMLPGEELTTTPTTDPRELERAFPWLADPLLENDSMTPAKFFGIECERVERIHSADQHGWFEAFFAALREIERIAGDTPLVVMLIPDEFQVEDLLWDRVMQRLGSDAFDRDQPQKRIAAWLAARSLPYLDLLPVMRAEPKQPDGWRHLYHKSDTHFNARGNRVAGEALARFLAERPR